MQRISTLLQKINDLATKEQEANVIDIDLMLDYTRVLYADLLEWRSRALFNTSLAPETTPVPPAPPVPTQVQETVPPPTQPAMADDDLQKEEEEPETVMSPTAMPVTEPLATPPQHMQAVADIRKWIGINDKYQFISELFGNDKEAYEATLNDINLSTDYNAAINALDEVHTQRGWQDEDLAIQSFYGIVSQFFSER